MNYGSVCTGIASETEAWHQLGWKPVFFAEIDPAASAVLKHRHPDVPNHGDFTTIQKGDYEPIDVLVGGTPCQDFSIAGLRAGVVGERGNLTLEFLRLADRLRPEWLVWENVPGVLSSTSHRSPDPCPPENPLDMECDGQEVEVEDFYPSDEVHAFNSFLAGLSELGYGWAYVVRDGQYFGVPQRRRRVFVVGHLGDWRRAAAVLFEFHSLCGHPPPSREKGQVAPTIPARSLGGGGLGTDFDCDGGLVESAPEWPARLAPTLNAHYGEKQGLEDQHIRGGQVCSSTGEIAHCLNAGGMGRQDFETETLLAVGGFFDPYVYCKECGKYASTMFCACSDADKKWTEESHFADLGVTHALRGEGFDASEDGTGRGTPLVAVAHCEVLPTMQNGADTEAGHNARSGNTKDSYIVPVAFRAAGQDGFTPSGQCPPIASTDGGGAGVPTVAYAFVQNTRDEVRLMGGDGAIAGALSAEPGAKQQCYIAIQNATRGKEQNRLGISDDGSMYTLDQGSQHAVAFQSSQSGVRMVDAHATLDSNNGSRRHNGVLAGMAVRRLTPRECERLMGQEDDYTLVPYRGKLMADGPRYKMLGNSIITHCMRWIGERIEMVSKL